MTQVPLKQKTFAFYPDERELIAKVCRYYYAKRQEEGRVMSEAERLELFRVKAMGDFIDWPDAEEADATKRAAHGYTVDE